MTPDDHRDAIAALEARLQEETARRQAAEAALEAREQFYIRMLDAMEDVAIECVDKNFTLLWANKNITRMAGKRLSEIQGHCCHHVIPELDAPCPDCGVVKAFATGAPQQFLRNGPGGAVWDMRSIPLFGLEGQVEAVLNYGVDITDKQAQATALARSEAAYRSLFEDAPIGIYTIDMDGDYKSMNAAHAAMYGYDSPEDMLTSIPSSHVLFAEPLQRRHMVAKLKKQGVVRDIESLMRRKDGSLFWTSRTIIANTTPAGVILGYTAYVEDIQTRKRAEAASEQSRSQLLEVLQRLQNCVVVLDAESERILYANRHAKMTMGPDLLGMLWRDCLHKEQPAVSLHQALCDESEHCSFEALYKDGRWRLVSVKRISWQGKDALLMVATDITPLKEAEALKEDVSLIMRHDLRSPLAGVIGLPELLQDSSCLDAKEKEILKAISAAGRRVMEMIDSSLLLFQLERGEYHLDPQPVNVAEVLRHIETDTQELFRQKRVALHQTHSPTPGSAQASGDKTLLYSCLANLIKNALEASPVGERVAVAVAMESSPRPLVTIRIHNQGEAPPEVLQRAFQKYVTHGKKGGAGLGLYSAHLIVKAHGGSIAMHSNAAEGTTLTVTLPGPEQTAVAAAAS